MNSELLDLVVCPLGKKPLRREGEFLVCTNCGLKYSLEPGFPVLLPEEAVLPDGIESFEELPCYTDRGETGST